MFNSPKSLGSKKAIPSPHHQSQSLSPTSRPQIGHNASQESFMDHNCKDK